MWIDARIQRKTYDLKWETDTTEKKNTWIELKVKVVSLLWSASQFWSNFLYTLRTNSFYYIPNHFAIRDGEFFFNYKYFRHPYWRNNTWKKKTAPLLATLEKKLHPSLFPPTSMAKCHAEKAATCFALELAKCMPMWNGFTTPIGDTWKKLHLFRSLDWQNAMLPVLPLELAKCSATWNGFACMMAKCLQNNPPWNLFEKELLLENSL